MLLRAGADPNTKTKRPGMPILHWNIHNGCPQVTKLLLQFDVDLSCVDDCGQNALHYCARVGCTADAELLLAAGMDPNTLNKYGSSPLCKALSGENVEMVKLLLKHTEIDLASSARAFESVVERCNNAKDWDRNVVQFLSLLFERGLDIETHCNTGDNVMAAAAFCGVYDGVEFCLKTGCKFDIKTMYGETVLSWLLNDYCDSARTLDRRLSLCEMLIREGADVNLLNSFKATPLESAVSAANVAGAILLLQANCAFKVSRDVKQPPHISKSQHEKEFKRFMAEALKQNAQYCAIFIFSDSCCSSEDQQYFCDISLQPEAMVDGERIGLTRPPLSLARLCRLAVRATLPSGAAFSPAVDKLPLPTYTKDYVALRV